MTILLQRICWNSNRWQGPTGELFGKEDSYVGTHGFGHEEWNFNTSDLLGGKVFGYTYYNPPEKSPLRGKKHDVYFFAIDKKKNRRMVGLYRQAEFLDESQRNDLKVRFSKSDIFKKRTDELLSLDLPPIKTNQSAEKLILSQFAANILVSPRNVHCYGEMPLLTSKMAGGRDPKFLSRYTKPAFLPAQPKMPTKVSELLPDGDFPKTVLLEDSYLRFTAQQRRVIERLHNQLSNRFRSWLGVVGANNVSAEKERIDVECVFAQERYLFELKTCFQQSTRHAIREAIGQILEYSYFPGRSKPNYSAVVLDTEPTPSEIEWCRALCAGGIQVELFWMKGEDVYSASTGVSRISKIAIPGAP